MNDEQTMTRRIVLELAEDTTDRICGKCRFLDANQDGFCIAYEIYVEKEEKRTKSRTVVQGLRLPECLAAEQEAARMVAIEPSTVALFIEAYDETDCPSVIADGTSMEHALAVIKTMGALRQHGSKAR